MSFGGYGGQPGDPFGGQPSGDPFGGQPSGDPFGGQSYGTPPAGQQSGGGWSDPPNYQMPVQQQPETNTLATLSIVFAFVFAPAGAALGHIALSQIKRLHQKGHGRAIAGLVLSYLIILVLIVGLVGWLVWPNQESTSPASPGSATSTTGTPGSSTSSAPKTGGTVKDFLLNGKELGELLDQGFESTPKTSNTGTDHMGDVSNPMAKASPAGCGSPIALGDKSTYASVDVQNFTSQSWYQESKPGNKPAVASVQEVVAELSTADAAKALFAQVTDVWKGCEGKTVTFEGTELPGGGYMTSTTTDVRTEDSILAATVQEGRSTSGDITTPSARTLAVKDKYVIETDVSFYDQKQDSHTGSGDPEQSGIDVAKAIMAKIG